jgi:hypothetical protein
MATLIKTYGYSKVWGLPPENHGGVKSLFWTGGMDIDGDGGPATYNPDNTGLDWNQNAKDGDKWVGVAVNDQGEPYIQGNNDPAPGYYVSTTSLQDSAKAIQDPARYVDSQVMPFIVLPGGTVFRNQGCKLGDLALVYNTATGDNSFAIYADVGPANQIGEGSMALAANLRIPASPKNGGISHGVAFFVWPGSGQGFLDNPTELKRRGIVIARQWSPIPNIISTMQQVIIGLREINDPEDGALASITDFTFDGGKMNALGMVVDVYSRMTSRD